MRPASRILQPHERSPGASAFLSRYVGLLWPFALGVALVGLGDLGATTALLSGSVGLAVVSAVSLR